MLEFARVAAARSRDAGRHDEPGLAVGLASDAEEVAQAQRLRYQVFADEMGAHLPQSHGGLDEDDFDRWCEHLLVRELETGRVVGTYRILTPRAARLAGRYYAESEFNLTGLGALRDQLVEFGRSCTDPEYRGGAAIRLLWSGLAEFLRRGGYRHVLGCASVSLRDDGRAAREVYRLAQAQPVLADAPTVEPLYRLPIERLGLEGPVGRVPPLIKGYLRLGARVCGEPAWDPDFHTADFPMLLSVDQMDARYGRHFGLIAEAA